MINADFEKLRVSGEVNRPFSDKIEMESFLIHYFRLMRYPKEYRPFIFKDRTNEAEARRGKY